ncbi:MAG TPA: hypothetical protein VFJ98_04700 [Mycobacteriales bacterium]|jgi:hypothetical protein|nr:hypothetical protein [Mycobacteriales bacterium]
MGGSGGRHRKVRVPVRPAVRVAVVAAFVATAGVTAATWPGAAVADAPVQTAWFNAMSGGGQSAPSPTTPAGGLRVSAMPAQVLAFGTVQYLFPAGSGGTMELKVAQSIGLPAINPSAQDTTPVIPIVACPTKGAWKAGDDQPIDSAPDWDCSIRQFVGAFSADGQTVTFLVDDGGQETPGVLSLAIVPVLTNAAPAVGTPLPVDTTNPFAIDFAKPEATSLAVTAPFGPPPDPGTDTDSTDDGAGTGGSTSGGGSGTDPGAGQPVPNVPLGNLPGADVQSPADPPVVAPQSPVGTGVGAPVAAAAPAKDTAHNVALALLLLLGLLVVGTSSGQLQRSPRLLGGAARHADQAGAAAAAVPVGAYGAPRGLGRFSKPRNGPPRPLI